MNKYGLLIIPFALYFAVGAFAGVGTAKEVTFAEPVFTDAFEKGCCLVVAKIVSVRKDGQMHYYRAKIVQPIIVGDLTEDDIEGSLDLFAGASYGDALKPGSSYALFVIKECPYHYSWAYRDQVLLIKASDKQALNRLARAANNAYSKTMIYKFRRGWQPVQEVILPALPDELLSLCDRFRTVYENRAEIGKKIFESDLGSRRDDSEPWSSSISYLPPKISLSRTQMVFLLGSPTLISGWTYSWFCGQVGRAEKQVGVLSATFDRNGMSTRVVFTLQERSKWTMFTGRTNYYTALPGRPDLAVYRFQRALAEQSWDQALSYCSPAVRTKAQQCDSAEAFLTDFVPIEQIIGLSGIRVGGHSAISDKITRLRFDGIPLEAPGAKWPVRWRWSLVWEDQWLIDFKTLPVKILVKKELLRRELEDEDSRIRMEKIKKGIEFHLIPITREFVISQPMLLRIEMINVSDIPILYPATGPTAIVANDQMNVVGPNGEKIKYVDTSYQIGVWHDVILSGESIIVADKYDVSSQYRIVKPGRYTFQFKGWPRHINLASNTVEVQVKPGEPSLVEKITEKLLEVLPEGWECTRTLVPKEGDENPFSETFIVVHLIGERAGKPNTLGILLYIFLTEDEIELEPEFASELELWGRCKWGAVYANVRDAERLWPNYREQIMKALGIKGK